MFQKLSEYDGNLVASRKSVTLPDKRRYIPTFSEGTPSSSKKPNGRAYVGLFGRVVFYPPSPHHSATLLEHPFGGCEFSVAHVVGIAPPYVLILRGLGTHVPRSWFITPVTNTLFPMIWLLMRWAHQTWVFHWYVVIWVARCTETAKPQKCGIRFSLDTCLPLFFSRRQKTSVMAIFPVQTTTWGC